MLFRSRGRPSPTLSDSQREALRAYERVRDHWVSCESCRSAASASSSLWCPQGIELMNRSVVDHAHWDTCPRCREAQERVQSGRCDLGRALEDEYRVLARRLAGA